MDYIIITLINNDFLVIKIHAGLVLTYSLIIHIITYFKKQTGSGWVAGGILVSFISIIIHSLKLSIHEWFNYKDIAHIVILISSIIMVKGILLKLKSLEL